MHRPRFFRLLLVLFFVFVLASCGDGSDSGISDSGSGISGTGGTADGADKGTNCGDGVWYTANLTNYTSYPDPGSEECVKYNGCTWAGWFYGLPDKQTEQWVQQHNIIAVHEKDWDWLGLKTLRLRQGNLEITATVYDLCSDADCNGCCTENLGGDGYLIDIEKYTMARFGSGEGTVEFQVCD